jgi:hypothetical protein
LAVTTNLAVLSDASQGQNSCKLQKFPADSRISGNLDAETGSILAASTTSVFIRHDSESNNQGPEIIYEIKKITPLTKNVPTLTANI